MTIIDETIMVWMWTMKKQNNNKNWSKEYRENKIIPGRKNRGNLYPLGIFGVE